MIPICLVTGFLGSGKTTYLRHVVESHRGRRIAYLVNEFSPTDVDGLRLDLPEGGLVSIAGGSIFCKCKVTDFITTLRKIQDQSPPPEGVVIEATGIANPKVMEQMLAETRLDEAFAVHSIIAVVDPGSFTKLIHTLPNIIAQVEAADTVILNKTDLYPQETLEATRAALAEIRPTAEIRETVFCRTDLDLFPSGASPRGLRGEYAKCADPNFAQVDIALAGPIDWPRLREALDAVRSVLYRAKGFIPTSAASLYADLSAGGWLIEADRTGPPGIVLIGRGDARDTLEALAGRIAAGEFAE